jgi:hypothetical protein
MQKLMFLNFSQLSPIWEVDEIAKITQLLATKHSIYLEDELFELESGYNKEQLQIKVCIKKNDGSVVYPLEIVCSYVDYPNFKLKELSNIIIDYIDLYWSEYLSEDRNLFVPLDWSRYESEGISFYLRGFVRNLALEMQADDFLNKYGFGEHDIVPISSET